MEGGCLRVVSLARDGFEVKWVLVGVYFGL